MERYLNSSGNSGVIGYEIDRESILVEFKGGPIYLYTYGSAGPANIEQMKTLAIAGRGLSTFIATVVKKGYASRVR